MKKPLIVITGATASGKTGLAIKLAKRLNGEIISADSRAIYKGIDIASAKPSLEERGGVIHWGFDLVEPNEKFTAFDFKQYTYEKIDDILSRGKIPFLVGGTGLYIDSVLRDYSFGVEADEELRKSLSLKSIEELILICKENNIELPENYKNKRYLIRAIEKGNNHKCYRGEKNNIFDCVVVGITTEREKLRERIYNRNVEFVGSGIIEEAIKMSNIYGWECESMTANAYSIIRDYLDGKINKIELVDKMTTRDWKLAKRQNTFMKRNKDIKWLNLEEAEQFIVSECSKKFFKIYEK